MVKKKEHRTKGDRRLIVLEQHNSCVAAKVGTKDNSERPIIIPQETPYADYHISIPDS